MSDLKRSDSRSTPTTAIFKGTEIAFVSEQDAYCWMIKRFLNYKPQLLTDTASNFKHLCFGARGATYFSQSKADIRKPHQLTNGWYVEMNLSNTQKICNLIKIANAAGLVYETDWKWDVLNRRTKAPIDVEALLAEIAKFARV